MEEDFELAKHQQQLMEAEAYWLQSKPERWATWVDEFKDSAK